MPGVNMFGGNQPPPVAPQSGGGTNMFGLPQDQSQSVDLPRTQAPPQELPKGAKGVDASGNPVFGDGIVGILKKWQYNFTKDVKNVDASAWQELKAKWEKSKNPQYVENGRGKAMTGNLTAAEQQAQDINAQNNIFSVGAEAVAKKYQDVTASSQGSPLGGVLKFTSATVTAVGDLFSLSAKYTEQTVGAMQGFREAASQVDSLLPRLDQNNFTKGFETTVVGGAYDVVRLALSPSDNKWDITAKKVEEGWQSGRILYSQVLDQTLKEKYLAEYRAGGDPQLIAEKLQNPLAELGGQLLLDPLNLVGAFAKAAKTAKELDAALEATKASGLLKTEEGVKALELLANAGDERSAVEALHTLTAAQAKAVEEVQSGSKLLNVTYDASSLTTTSRQNALIGKGKELLGNMALLLKQNGMSYDGIAEAILHGVYSVSKNEDEMRLGLSGLSKLPNANMWLSDDYIETFSVMHQLMADESGVLNGSKLFGLMKAENPAEFATAAQKLLVAAAKSDLPDVGELAKAATLAKQAAKEGLQVTAETAARAKQYEVLPNHVKYLDKINTTLSTYIKNPINKVLSPLYFNLQGGVAVKNVLANNELILIDKGIGAWFKDGKYWSTADNVEYLKNVFEELPSSAHGFTSLVAGATDAKPFLFGKWMEAGEEAGAARIVAASVRDTFAKMIPKALDTQQAVKDGLMTQAQADKFSALALKHGGNLEKALTEFRDFYKVGAVEAWRNLDFVTDFQRQALDKMGYWDEIANLAHNGAASQADVEKVFNKMLASIDSRSELATKDLIGLSSDHPGAPAWGDLMKAVDDGHLNPNDQQVFTAIMESAEQARLEYQGLLDDVALKASTALAQEKRMQEAQHIGQEMNRIRDVLRKAGPETAKEAHEITQDAWRWSDAIKDTKSPTVEELKAFWNKAGLIGDPPLDLDKKSLLKTLWQQRFDKVKGTWNSSFDVVFAESETVLKQMEGVVDTNELKSMASRTRNITEQAQAYRSAIYEKGALRIPSETTAEEVAAGIKKSVAIPPPHPLGSDPSFPRAWNESAKGAKYTLDQIKNKIFENWGKTDDARQFNPAMEAALKEAVSKATPKIGEIKSAALKIATEQRNFTLLNYGERTYADVAKSYIMPYHFFYTRSYKNWISRLATNPELVAGYAKYKTALEGINKDLPDWYKQQLNINPFSNQQVADYLGIDKQNPLFINLEASLNPLYGLTGTDYNDPAKRTNWATATIDDMGKFGPTLWAPIQLGIAATLYAQGETDAASRWGSRLIPETAQIKSLTSMFGKPLELDPAVRFFSGGIEATDRGRMGYAAAELIKNGEFTPEEVQSAFQQQSGPAWDKAYQMAVQSRTASSVSSYFLGVGFKPRGANDVMVEDMYVNLNKLYSMSDMMSGDQYKQAWEQLRSQYPDGLVDTVLLAKKGGAQRDAAYAYGVLGRLPPTEMSQLFKDIGIGEQDVNKFYESKGFSDPNVKFTETEKQRFMAAIIDLGAMLKIPDNATRQEWGAVKEAYNTDLEEIAKQVGMPYEKDAKGKVVSRGVWDELNHYYDLKDMDKAAADAFEQQHPEVMMALQLKREAIVNSPQLAAYYGGLDTIEAYISGNVREQLSQKFGKDIYQLQTDYFNADNPKTFIRQHPELKRFWSEKDKLESASEATFNQLASKLPETKPAQFQPGYTPQSGVQQTLYQGLQPTGQIPQWQEVSQEMPPWLQQEIAQHATQGTKLSKRAESEMKFLAGQADKDVKNYIMEAGLAYQQYLYQPQTQQGTGVNMFGP